MVTDKKVETPNNRSDDSSNNLNDNKHNNEDSDTDMKAFQNIVVPQIWSDPKELVEQQIRRHSKESVVSLRRRQMKKRDSR